MTEEEKKQFAIRWLGRPDFKDDAHARYWMAELIHDLIRGWAMTKLLEEPDGCPND